MPEIFPVASILPFCFLLVCMVDQTQIYLSSISPTQEIICNIHRVIFIGQVGATSQPSSYYAYYAFNLASYNWTVSFKSCTCLMLFGKGNLKMHLSDKHQRGTTFTSRIPILKRTYCRTFYSPFYVVYGLSKWYILHFTINGPNYFFYSSPCIGCWTSIILITVTSYLF